VLARDGRRCGLDLLVAHAEGAGELHVLLALVLGLGEVCHPEDRELALLRSELAAAEQRAAEFEERPQAGGQDRDRAEHVERR
jgi:hypothetical protein